uniref:HTH_48 domain-containing protein n=1 Tax=Glossina pallidipes TaxID=7398 RepID=A0A1B0AF30_GLOPL
MSQQDELSLCRGYAKRTFKEDNFNVMVLRSSGEAIRGDQKEPMGGIKGVNSGQSNIFKIVKMISERDFAPVIVFSFSKKDSEIYAMQIAKLNFNTADEKKLIDGGFNNALDVLSEKDRQFPQVENVLPLLWRGKKGNNIKMRIDNHTYICRIMLYYFEKREEAAQPFRDLSELFGEDRISESRCREWLARLATLRSQIYKSIMGFSLIITINAKS